MTLTRPATFLNRTRMHTTAATAVLLIGAVTLAGCASPRERLYTLLGPEPPRAASGSHLHIVVGPVTIPGAVDRPQLVVRQGATRLVALEQERWAEPLREAVPQLLAESVGERLPTAHVTTLSAAVPAAPDLRVMVDVTRLEAIPNQEVIVEARWSLRSPQAKVTPEGTTVVRRPVHGGTREYATLVRAEAAALAEVGSDIARAVEKIAP